MSDHCKGQKYLSINTAIKNQFSILYRYEYKKFDQITILVSEEKKREVGILFN